LLLITRIQTMELKSSHRKRKDLMEVIMIKSVMS